MARIRPFNKKKDLIELEGEVTQLINDSGIGTNRSVMSDKLFGFKEGTESYENTGVYNMSAFIDLALEVLNPFLSGKDPCPLSVILGKDVGPIARGDIAYVKSSDTVVHTSDFREYEYSSDILIGGRYILYLIDELDVEKEIMVELAGIMSKCLGEEDIDMSMIGRDGSIHIFADYYYAAEGNVGNLQDVVHEVVRRRIDSYNSRLTYLCNCEKSVLRDLVMSTVVVLPRGYRESFKKKKDELTVAYDSIVRCNNAVKNALERSVVSLPAMQAVYKDLVNAVTHVMTENKNRYNDRYKPLLGRLKGKKGLIRNRMQAARLDYSGRSVIISDPGMSMDSVGIPRSMLEKMYELDILDKYSANSGNKSDIFKKSNRKLRSRLVDEVVADEYITIGRQPTLYQLGLRGFKVVPVDGDAVVLSPANTSAFNADFDGDQMHCEASVGIRAKEESRKLLNVENNVFLPRNGECHIAPRQEMIHGLWKASEAKVIKGKSGRFKRDSYEELLENVCNGEINIYDEVTIGGFTEVAGKAAIRACFPREIRNIRLGVIPITAERSVSEVAVSEKFFKEVNKYVKLHHSSEFVNTVDRVIRLGFAVTNVFSPKVSILDYPDVQKFKDEFEEVVRQREELYNMGFDTDSAFYTFYSNEYRKLEKRMKEYLVEQLGEDSGFVEMMKSGTRGNESNIMQIFGMKGRVKKNEFEAFNAVIKGNCVSQLTELEHAITAYGGREGLIDKTLATYGPGYFSRKLSHTTSMYSITCEDCGDTEGILFDYAFLKQFIGDKATELEIANNKYVRDFTLDILAGRFMVGSDSLIRDRESAMVYYEKYIAEELGGELVIKEGLRMRSPITCKNPCCSRCYGISLSTMRMAVVGEPVGAVASGSIGEPGTQLIMKNFQSGGVAGVKNLTSSFGLTQGYVELTNLKKPGEPLSYDYIAPYAGKIRTVSRGDGTKMLQILTRNKDGKQVNAIARNRIVVFEDVKLKDYVERGESIQEHQGYMNMQEVMEYRGVPYARKYLAVVLFSIYRPEAFVNLKHFEMVVLGMSFKLCCRGNSYFKPGLYYTMQEYYSHDTSGCIFFEDIKGTKQVPLYRNDVFSTLELENIQKGISRSILLSGVDEMKLPIVRYMFGLGLGFGSDIEGFVERRAH